MTMKSFFQTLAGGETCSESRTDKGVSAQTRLALGFLEGTVAIPTQGQCLPLHGYTTH